MYFVRRNRTELTPENLKHLENVFRENLAKDKEEFTLAEFKKIVPSKNVSAISFIFKLGQNLSSSWYEPSCHANGIFH